MAVKPLSPGAAAMVPRRLRLAFRLAFIALLAATLALAIDVLQEEKQRSQRAYAEGVRKSEAQIAARLAHPTGQLMLLNAAAADLPATPLVPLVLPFGAIDFDDRAKAQQAVELAGCGVVYGDGATLCAGIGSNALAGAFVYVVGQLPAAALVAHRAGQLDISQAHRAWVEVRTAGGGASWRWIAPYQAQGESSSAAVPAAVPPASPSQRGRLVAFDGDAEITADSRPQREVRGWMWQEGACMEAGGIAPAGASPAASAPTSPATPECARRTYLSLRLPVATWREAVELRGAAAWPPVDLAATQVRVQLLGPGEGNVLFDSDNPARGGTAAASAPFALAEFRRLLLPGETLRVQREGFDGVVLEARGEASAAAAAGAGEAAWPWLDALIRWLPVEGFDRPIESRSIIATRLGNYRLTLLGDLRTVNRQLADVATRLAGYVGTMLAAVLLLWLLLETVVMRRIALLTRRAAAVSGSVRAAAAAGSAQRLNLAHDFQDLSGRDELGVLAQGLTDLLARVNADVEREQIRTRQEREQWHAVGHEIVSPLQSLIALHGAEGDPAARYLHRMQQAVRVLYGQASPSEAFESTQLTLAPLDLNAFVATVAANAHHVGIEGVAYASPGTALPVLADEHSLEDVVTHVLRNAARHRTPGTPITLSAQADAREVRLAIHNAGAHIAPALLPRIFDYGVSGASPAPAPAQPGRAEGEGAAGHPAVEGTGQDSGQRGQGLFVARTYMAKMGGHISVRNVAGGVTFTLALPRAALQRTENGA